LRVEGVHQFSPQPWLIFLGLLCASQGAIAFTSYVLLAPHGITISGAILAVRWSLRERSAAGIANSPAAKNPAANPQLKLENFSRFTRLQFPVPLVA